MPPERPDEVRRLRNAMRDLVALSTLPAVWVGYAPEGIAGSLADVLLGALALDLIYVRVRSGAPDIEIARGKGVSGAQARAIGAALAPVLASVDAPVVVADPLGRGDLRVAVARFGHTADQGVVVACSRRADFPAESDRLLLGVGANQAATALQRRRAEAALRESEEKFRALVTATSNAVYRMSPDWSEMRHLVGREFIADALEPTRSWLDTYVPADEKGRITAAIAEAVRAKKPFELEHRVRRADGGVAWAFSRAIPVLDARGAIVEWFGAASDITARKGAEERVRESEEKYRTLFETMDEGFCVFEMVLDDDKPVDYRFLEVNPAFERLTGLCDAAGRTMRELAPAHDEHWFEIYGRVARTGEPVRFVQEARALGDRWFDLYAFRLGDEGSRRVAVIFNDITERTRAEQEREDLVGRLRDADRHKDEFLALLAHELRNPLAPIRNGLQVLAMSDRPETRERAVAMMGRQLGQMVRLVDDLMDVSRIGRDKLELKRERVPLADVLASAVETSRPLIDQMGHELTYRPPDRGVVVDADLTRLAQVFLNLLNNAAKYMNRGGRIWLTAAPLGAQVQVSVRDAGVGIAADQLPRIFDLFSQVDRSLEKAQGGLGIGLTLVRRLTELHGGTVEARSDGPGEGSVFVVRLPAVAAAVAPAERHEERPAPTAHRILIVDDNRDGADSLSEMMGLFGNDTRTAYDGEAAVAAAVSFRPDVILLDLGLPKLNGYEACRRIRAQRDGRQPVIIAQTGWGADGDRQRTREAGFDHHLVKPIDPSALMKLLTEAASSR